MAENVILLGSLLDHGENEIGKNEIEEYGKLDCEGFLGLTLQTLNPFLSCCKGRPFGNSNDILLCVIIGCLHTPVFVLHLEGRSEREREREKSSSDEQEDLSRGSPPDIFPFWFPL